MTGLEIFCFILGIALHYIIIFWIIRIAFVKESKYQKIQTAILAKMAKKAGVSADDIDDLFKIEKLRILS